MTPGGTRPIQVSIPAVRAWITFSDGSVAGSITELDPAGIARDEELDPLDPVRRGRGRRPDEYFQAIVGGDQVGEASRGLGIGHTYGRHGLRLDIQV